MNTSDIKGPILVGALYVLITREWFDNLFYGSFPILSRSPMLFFIVKVMLIMVLYYVLDKLINPSY
jgi:hypothetical protein